MTPDRDRSPTPRGRKARGERALLLVLVLVLALTLPAASLIASATGEETPMIPSSFEQMFESSRSDKKGLTLYVQGQTVAGVVTAFSDEVVEMRSQQYDRIVVRIDRIDAVARQ